MELQRPKNMFFSAPRRGSNWPLRGNDCIRKVVADVSQLQYPKSIKSTQLRKYCATVTQITDLDEKKLRWLADHLGHNLDVHREYYRLKESTIQLSYQKYHISFYEALDEGNSKDMTGKKSSEIEIEEMASEMYHI